MRTTSFALCSLLSLAACSVGDPDGGGGGDDTNTPDDRLCNATLAITGNYVRGAAAPDLVNNQTNEPGPDGIPDISGCWPTGTWTFRATVEEHNCATAPVPAPEYRFVTTYTANGSDGQGGEYSYQLQAPALSDNYRLKVSSGGGGECEGVMELYLDGAKKAWYLHPALNAFNMDAPLTGTGDYAEYDEAIYP